MSVHLYLTRKNLNALLTKLDRDGSLCTIIKSDTVHPEYPLIGTDVVYVTAVEDEDYYTDRPAGKMFEELQLTNRRITCRK
jgi:hypothetical protein